MTKQKEYNGHPSWSHWNVSLWLLNDEHYYNALANEAEEVAYMKKTRYRALKDLIKQLPFNTPDGARFRLDYIAPAFDELVVDMIEHS